MISLPLHDSEIPHVVAALNFVASTLRGSPNVADQVTSCTTVATRLRDMWLTPPAAPTDLGSL